MLWPHLLILNKMYNYETLVRELIYRILNCCFKANAVNEHRRQEFNRFYAYLHTVDFQTGCQDVNIYESARPMVTNYGDNRSPVPQFLNPKTYLGGKKNVTITTNQQKKWPIPQSTALGAGLVLLVFSIKPL